MQTASPVASIIVPAYRAADTIAECLGALQAQSFREPYEVIVVASGDDSTPDIVRRNFRGMRLFASHERLTPGSCRNIGFEHSRGEFVAFIAADCIAGPHWLARRVEAHRAGHLLVSGFVDVDRNSNRAGWVHYFAKFWPIQVLANHRGTGPGPLMHLSFTREVIERFGPFPASTVAGEDTIYDQRIVASGVPVYFDSAIRVSHLSRRSAAEVKAGDTEQCLWAGWTCRGHEIARYFPHLTGGSALTPLRLALRGLKNTARFREGLALRYLALFPSILRGLINRRRAFRRGYFELREAPPGEFGSEASEVATFRTRAPRVTAIVPAFNEAKVIRRCLDSLLAQSLDDLEILVADDGSTDGTAALAATRGGFVACLDHRGAARAKNAAARLARGEVVVFVDADLELDPGCLELLAGPIAAGAAAGTFTKEIFIANEHRIWSRCWALNRGFPSGRVLPDEFPDEWENFRAVRRDLYLRAGGYDDVGYGEDMTLAPKLKTLARAVPGAVMWHHNPDTLREIWGNARWMGKGARIREVPGAWRRYTPWRSVRQAIRIARDSCTPPFLLFKIIYDLGVLTGYAASSLAPRRHWK